MRNAKKFRSESATQSAVAATTVSATATTATTTVPFPLADLCRGTFGCSRFPVVCQWDRNCVCLRRHNENIRSCGYQQIRFIGVSWHRLCHNPTDSEITKESF